MTESAGLTKVFDDTLVKLAPVNAAVRFPDSAMLSSRSSRWSVLIVDVHTLVMNHDTVGTRS
jgi:hypothetical protein